MHVIEATTIMKNEPPVGRSDVSECLPGWINTICNAYERGEGYTLSHSAVSALAHTLICARVRAERLVRERDEAIELLRRYREEVPIGHQPHMICHLVDAVVWRTNHV
jgi:hypothetical protein